MAETDNNQYSGSKRVNMKILGGVPSFYKLAIELRELKEKKKNNMDKMGKLLLAIIFTFGVF